MTQVAGARTIALAPLSDAETGALVSELLGPDPSISRVGRTIAERAAGNPFFAEEIVRDLAERAVLRGEGGAYFSSAEIAEVSVPATLQATIAARIDRLDPNSKRTLSAAAVIGSRFDLDLLTVLGIEPVVADLVAAQFIDQVRFTRQHVYVFHHPLIRAVAYESQLKSDRTELHRRAAAAIEQRSAGSLDENAALIARVRRLCANGDRGATGYRWPINDRRSGTAGAPPSPDCSAGIASDLRSCGGCGIRRSACRGRSAGRAARRDGHGRRRDQSETRFTARSGSTPALTSSS